MPTNRYRSQQCQVSRNSIALQSLYIAFLRPCSCITNNYTYNFPRLILNSIKREYLTIIPDGGTPYETVNLQLIERLICLH